MIVIGATFILSGQHEPLNQFTMKREYIPIESLPAWQRLNGIVVQGIAVHKIGSDQHGADKGSALIATEAQTSSEHDTNPKILLKIPSELVLSLESVQNHAKTDRYLRDVLEAVGDFGRVWPTRSTTSIYITMGKPTKIHRQLEEQSSYSFSFKYPIAAPICTQHTRPLVSPIPGPNT
jgi:hypothetical protein